MKCLIISMSTLSTDPRILREAKWLSSQGYFVDTVGIGKRPSSDVTNHYALAEQPQWTTKRILGGLILVFAPFRMRYLLLTSSRIPKEIKRKIKGDNYDLVVINDIEFLPWLVKPFNRRGLYKETKVLLDLHEYHPANLPDGTAYRFLQEGYWRWLRKFIPSGIFNQRTVVSPGIAETYKNEFGVPLPDVICNAPDYEELTPSITSKSQINLIYHGHASWDRHPELLLDAFNYLDDRFVLHLMLTGSSEIQEELKTMAKVHGNKIKFHQPVKVEEIARTINQFDLEMLFFPPDNPNILFTFPNKFFEAIQGRLGLVMGRSPSMVAVAESLNNALIVDGWSAEALATSLNNLTKTEIDTMKNASDSGARILNSEAEKQKFLRIVTELVTNN